MDLIVSNTWLTAFSAGTIFGITSTYLFIKYRPNGYNFSNRNKVPTAVPMEERYEVKTIFLILLKMLLRKLNFPDLAITDEYRLILAVRNDLKMQKGKVAAQCGHASVAAYAKALKSQPNTLNQWLKYGGTKVTVRLDSEEELLELNEKAKSMNILSSIVRDAGQTQVAPGTRTVIAIGPAPKSILTDVTGHLKLY